MSEPMNQPTTKTDQVHDAEGRMCSSASGVEYSKGYAAWMPNNCAVIERTADGVSVELCTLYLENGTTCPRHGKVKPYNRGT